MQNLSTYKSRRIQCAKFKPNGHLMLEYNPVALYSKSSVWCNKILLHAQPQFGLWYSTVFIIPFNVSFEWLSI